MSVAKRPRSTAACPVHDKDLDLGYKTILTHFVSAHGTTVPEALLEVPNNCIVVALCHTGKEVKCDAITDEEILKNYIDLCLFVLENWGKYSQKNVINTLTNKIMSHIQLYNDRGKQMCVYLPGMQMCDIKFQYSHGNSESDYKFPFFTLTQNSLPKFQNLIESFNKSSRQQLPPFLEGDPKNVLIGPHINKLDKSGEFIHGKDGIMCVKNFFDIFQGYEVGSAAGILFAYSCRTGIECADPAGFPLDHGIVIETETSNHLTLTELINLTLQGEGPKVACIMRGQTPFYKKQRGNKPKLHKYYPIKQEKKSGRIYIVIKKRKQFLDEHRGQYRYDESKQNIRLLSTFI